MIDFSIWLQETLLSGLSEMWNFVSSSFVTTVLSIIFGAFIALRAFYLQKRHERMADKYEEILDRLSEMIEHSESQLLLKENEQDLEGASLDGFLRLARRRTLYFSQGAKDSLSALTHEVTRLAETGGTDKEFLLGYSKALRKCSDALLEQARIDLRPNLIEFVKEFFSISAAG